jgi:hypothetical protein
MLAPGLVFGKAAHAVWSFDHWFIRHWAYSVQTQFQFVKGCLGNLPVDDRSPSALPDIADLGLDLARAACSATGARPVVPSS